MLPVPLLRIREKNFEPEHTKPKQPNRRSSVDSSTDGVMSYTGFILNDSGFQETSPDFTTLTTRKTKTNYFNNEKAAFEGLNTSFLNGESCLCEFCVNNFINNSNNNNTHYDYSYMKQGCKKYLDTYKSTYSYHVNVF